MLGRWCLEEEGRRRKADVGKPEVQQRSESAAGGVGDVEGEKGLCLRGAKRGGQGLAGSAAVRAEGGSGGWCVAGRHTLVQFVVCPPTSWRALEGVNVTETREGCNMRERSVAAARNAAVAAAAMRWSSGCPARSTGAAAALNLPGGGSQQRVNS